MKWLPETETETFPLVGKITFTFDKNLNSLLLRLSTKEKPRTAPK